jgi:hypothetical protein
MELGVAPVDLKKIDGVETQWAHSNSMFLGPGALNSDHNL